MIRSDLYFIRISILAVTISLLTSACLPLGSGILNGRRQKTENSGSTTVTFSCTDNALITLPFANSAESNTGTSSNPFKICTAAQLNQVRNYLNDTNVYFELWADIDLSFASAGFNFAPIGAFNNTASLETLTEALGQPTTFDWFAGKFNGRGHTISNWTYSNATRDGAGLFGGTLNATIKDLKLVNVNITGRDGVGALTGMNFESHFKGISVDSSGGPNSTVTGNQVVGGMSGLDYMSVWHTSYTAAEVTGGSIDTLNLGSSLTGGFAGLGIASMIIESFSAAPALTSGLGTANGFYGMSQNGIFANAYYYDYSGSVTDANATGLSVGQVGIANSYTGFNFSSTWSMGSSHPTRVIVASSWDETAPTVSFTSTSPTSPGSDATPNVRGSLNDNRDSDSNLIVFLYDSNLCDNPIGFGVGSTFDGGAGITISAIDPGDTVSIYSIATDSEGNQSSCAALTSYTFLVPVVTISSTTSANTNLSPIPVTFTFNESVTGFTSGDVTVGNGTLSNFAGSGSSYTADVTPTAAGDVTIDIAAAVAQDTAGSDNIAAVQFVRYYVGANTGTAYPSLNGPVNTSIQLTDGSVILGGNFSAIEPTIVPSLAKLDTNGVHDASCVLDGGFDAEVKAIVKLADGKLIVGGSFTEYRGVAVPRGLAKLNADCSLNADFSGSGFGSNNYVSALFVDGTDLYVGGYFSSYNGGTIASGIAKFSTTGTFDAAFDTAAGVGFDSNVETLVVSGTDLYVGGRFTKYKNVAVAAGVIKLDTSGAKDTTFQTQAGTGFVYDTGTPTNANIYSLILDGTDLYVGGSFTHYNGNAAAPNGLAKLSTVDGSLDATFTTNAAGGFTYQNGGYIGPVYDIKLSGGAIYAVGTFSEYAGSTCSYHVAKIATDGTIDTTFNTDFGTKVGNTPSSISIDGGSLYLTDVTYFDNTGGFGHMIKVSTGGVLDTTFNNNLGEGFNNTVNKALVTGGEIYTVGNFTTLGGTPIQNYLVKLDSSGKVDQLFQKNLEDNPHSYAISAIASDGTNFYVGGELKKITQDGEPMASFNSILGTPMSVVDLQWSGSYLYAAGGAKGIYKIDSNGNINSTFDSNVGTAFTSSLSGNGLTSLVVSGSDLYVGGSYNAYNGNASAARGIIHMSTSGVLNTTHNTNAGTGFYEGAVYALAASGSGVFVGGMSTTTYNNASVSPTDSLLHVLSSGLLDATHGNSGTFTAGTFNSGIDNLALDYISALTVSGSYVYALGGSNGSKLLKKFNATTGAEDLSFVGELGREVGNSSFINVIGSELWVGGNITTCSDGSTEVIRSGYCRFDTSGNLVP